MWFLNWKCYFHHFSLAIWWRPFCPVWSSIGRAASTTTTTASRWTSATSSKRRKYSDKFVFVFSVFQNWKSVELWNNWNSSFFWFYYECRKLEMISFQLNYYSKPSLKMFLIILLVKTNAHQEWLNLVNYRGTRSVKSYSSNAGSQPLGDSCQSASISDSSGASRISSRWKDILQVSISINLITFPQHNPEGLVVAVLLATTLFIKCSLGINRALAVNCKLFT